MKIILFGLSIVFFISSQASQTQEFVRVRILQNQKKIELSGTGISVQGEEKEFQQISIPKQNQQVKISRVQMQKKMVWKVEFSDSPKVRFYLNSALYIHAQQLMYGALHLPTKIILNAKKNFDLIGFVPMNDYLYGVVSKEMPANWPKEALKAQAIAARTYTLYMKKEKSKNSFDVESSILDQVFSKIENLSINPQLQDAVKTAVDETQGVYLSQKNGLPVKTYYHADCGGKTSSSESVFGTKGLVGGIQDESCPANPKAKWSFEISKTQLKQKLARFFQEPSELLQITQIEKLQDRIENRAKEIRLVSASGEKQIINANDFRESLGYQDLRSTNFQVIEKEGKLLFQGKGYGHGVGMCQWGTKKMAEKGIDFQRILAHYYPELDLNTAKNLQGKEGHRDQNKNFLD